jgi:hypothetical protein
MASPLDREASAGSMGVHKTRILTGKRNRNSTIIASLCAATSLLTIALKDRAKHDRWPLGRSLRD